MVNHTHYAYRIIWSTEDNEYIGLCSEFPSLSWLDKDPIKAISGIMDVVKDVIEDMLENGEAVPEPISEKKYSGKFQVRIPPEQHRRLAIQAAEEGVSLNRLISSRLN